MKKLSPEVSSSTLNSVLTSTNIPITTKTACFTITTTINIKTTSHLSSILLQTENTLVESASFKDLRNYEVIKNQIKYHAAVFLVLVFQLINK